jgi:hypothetical protein
MQPTARTKRARTPSRRNSSSSSRTKRARTTAAAAAPDTEKEMITVFRRFISNLNIREQLLQNNSSGKYSIGPTILWLPTDFLRDNITEIRPIENQYHHYILIAGKPNVWSTKIRNIEPMTKGTIMLRAEDSTGTNVHFCGYIVDEKRKLFIFDPAWHKKDKNPYSEDKFYNTLTRSGKIKYTHVYKEREHAWQNILPHDVFCQTWSLVWLLRDGEIEPVTDINGASHAISNYFHEINAIIHRDKKKYISLFPRKKWGDYNYNAIYGFVNRINADTIELYYGSRDFANIPTGGDGRVVGYNNIITWNTKCAY